MSAATITLAGKEYPIRPLTVGQIIELTEMVDAGGSPMSRIVDTIVAGLKRDHPEITRQALLDTESTAPELRTAFMTIQRLSGLVAEAGEAAAGPTPPAPTGGA